MSTAAPTTKPPVELEELAINTIRTLAIDAVEAANSGHPGAPMGLAPLGYLLYSQILRHDPADPQWPGRDRFVLSNGHASMLQYALLHLSGYAVSLDDIKQFRQWDSICPGHPEYGITPGVEVTTGPLGQGIANSVGFAIAEEVLAARYNRPGHDIINHAVFTIVGDGDMQEGVASEAASLAGHLGLGKLTVIYDANEIQIEGPTSLAFSENVGDRFRAYNWHVQELRAEATLAEISDAIEAARAENSKPSMIVLPTHIGYGSPNKQDSAAAHGTPLGTEEARLTKENLGWDPDAHFLVPDEVRELFAPVKERGAELHAQWQRRFDEYATEYPTEAEELRQVWDHAPVPLPDPATAPSLAEGKKKATRASSGEAINWLAPSTPRLIGGSADLAPSTSTLVKDGGDIAAGAFEYRNMRFGVREHAMGAIVNGMTIEGLRAYTATFLVFSDYMRPAIRLAALMEIPSTFVFTHDSIHTGEDGPTHQPVEHFAALRTIPNLDVIRPADHRETMLAWEALLGREDGPTAILLTRQGVPALDPDAIPDDGVERGAYILSEPENGAEPQAILIGTGSEVSLCVEAAARLNAEGIPTRVVSMPSWERFARQDRAYCDSVLLPASAARLAVEAGVPDGWERWTGYGAGPGGMLGIERFGASAPGPVVAEKLGFTADNVINRVQELINS